MTKAKIARTVAAAGEVVRQFSRFSDLALTRPVFITKNGRPRNVLISADEYQRLKSRDRTAIMAGNTPEEFLPQLEEIARDKRKR